MSEGERTCGNCRYWENPSLVSRGECHAHPPQIVEIIQEVQTVAWPETLSSDWCGQWARADDG